METGHQMCRTRDRTAFQSTRENSTLVRTSQSARRNQKTRLELHRARGGEDQTSLVRGWTKQKICTLIEVHKRHGFLVLTVRGHKLVLGRVYQAGTVRYTKIRSTTPKRMTRNDANNAALFLVE